MAYTPPSNTAVNFTSGETYTPPSNTAVNFSLAAVDITIDFNASDGDDATADLFVPLQIDFNAADADTSDSLTLDTVWTIEFAADDADTSDSLELSRSRNVSTLGSDADDSVTPLDRLRGIIIEPAANDIDDSSYTLERSREIAVDGDDADYGETDLFVYLPIDFDASDADTSDSLSLDLVWVLEFEADDGDESSYIFERERGIIIKPASNDIDDSRFGVYKFTLDGLNDPGFQGK